MEKDEEMTPHEALAILVKAAGTRLKEITWSANAHDMLGSNINAPESEERARILTAITILTNLIGTP